MIASVIGFFALSLCLAATLDPGEAGVFRGESSAWPSDNEETTGLGAGRGVFRDFCLSAREQIKKVVDNSDASGRVFSLMANFCDRNGDIIHSAKRNAPGLRAAARVSAACRPIMYKEFIDTKQQVDEDNLQVGLQSVCNADKVRPLWRKLQVQLIDFQRANFIPFQFGKTVSLYELGCKSATRLRQALVDCEWYMKVSRHEIRSMEDPRGVGTWTSFGPLFVQEEFLSVHRRIAEEPWWVSIE